MLLSQRSLALRKWTGQRMMKGWCPGIDKSLHEEIIRKNHDSIIAGHPGRYKTHELVTRNYWWPNIMNDIQKYINRCQSCQKTKPRNIKPAAPLHPNEIPSEPWQIISLDLIGPLPELN